TEIALIAGMIFYTVPMAMMISWKTAVELGLGFFDFLALFSTINYCNENKNKWLYLAGIFSGISLGGKYTGFFGFVALTFLIFLKILLFDKNKLLYALKKLFTFGIIAFLVTSIWYIKNFIITGSPFYPILSKFTSHMKSPDLRIIELTLSNILTFPWKYTMGELQQETYLGPIFLIFLPLVLFFKRINKNIKYLYVYFCVFFVLWFFIGFAYCRFLVVGLPAICIIMAYYIISPNWNNLIRKCLIVFLIFTAFENIYYAALIQKSTMDPFGFVLGLQSKKDYLLTQRATYPCPYYQVVEWINENIPESDKILLLGECRGYYIKRKFLTHMVDVPNPLKEYCKDVNSGDELYIKLKKDGIAYILFNVPEARRLASYDIFCFSKRELKILTEFWNKYIEEVYSACADITLNDGRYASKVPEFWNRYTADIKNYVYVYRLLSDDELKKPHKIPFNFFLIPEIYNSDRYSKLKPTIDLLSFWSEERK
ncbi:MAG: glycosyltransferase family 39 protein, partial [Elusimicrobiota bacterium]|nr:glycosyltransferase family 39 protein [Elusimicrobiota bacterium]